MTNPRSGVAAILVLALTASAPGSGAGQTPAIDTSTIRTHASLLAHDSMLGRDTGSPQSMGAARYIADACHSLGLEMLGDSYLHPVPLRFGTVLQDGTALVISSPASPTEFSYPPDFFPCAGPASTRRAFSGTAAYVGTDADILDASSPRSLGGASVAVTLGGISSAAATRLAEAGFTATVHLLPDSSAYAQYRAIRDGRTPYNADPTVPSSFFGPLASAVAGPAVARAVAPLIRPGGVMDVSVTLELRMSTETVDAANVACALPGAGPDRDHAIAFAAHYDHLGVSEPDAAGDSIYNGFSDNASGVAMLLAIAESLARRGERPGHTVLFLFFTGEERGFLGSDHYVARPPWPLERMIGLINLDAGAPPARPTSWEIAGGLDVPLGALAVAVGEREGWAVRTSSIRPISDYFPFALAGVPSILIIPGPDPYDGVSADSSDALRRRWDRYHQPGDAWHPAFPFGGLGRYAAYALGIALELDRRGREGLQRPLREPGGMP